MISNLGTALEGFLLSGGLIIAIGAQNAFVLRQGLVRSHVGAVATVCALSDAALIALGIAGAGSLVSRTPILGDIMTLGGAAFLLVYGLMALRRAMTPHGGEVAAKAETGLWAAIGTCLALTFLNPHVYLDTLVLIGAVSARHQGAAALAFGVGAVLASVIWFYGLAYGARLAAPLFTRPVAWRYLDLAIAIVMLTIAGSLVVDYLGN